MSNTGELYDEDIIQEQLLEEIPCRTYQIGKILQLIAQPRNLVPQSIFIYGHTGTGKTYVIARIFNKLNYRHVFVNCIQCYMPKLLFGHILCELSGCEEREAYANCDNVMDFINHLKMMSCTKPLGGNVTIIVFDKCEKLREMDSNLLPAMLRLQELTKLNICVMFVSSIVWEKFYLTTGIRDPIQIHFTQYSKEEVFKIMLWNHNWPSMDGLFQNYVNLFLSVCYRSCRDLKELQHMVNVNFLKHCEPVISGKADASKLWQVITPHLKSSLGELYLRIVSSKSLDDVRKTTGHQRDESSTKLALSFELPYYSKYFLIAAFLASYSPPKWDKHLFVKFTEKKKRSKKIGRSKEEVLNDMLLGPKPFAVDRLLAIFYSIVGEEVNFTANLSAQVSTLVKLRLLTEMNDSLDQQKYKCVVGLDFIKIIAKTVGFDIMKFLIPPM